MRRSEGMLEVIEQMGVANGDHQGKSFNPRSLTTSTFILDQMTVVLCCMEHSPYTTTTFGNYLHIMYSHKNAYITVLKQVYTHTHTHTHMHMHTHCLSLHNNINQN